MKAKDIAKITKYSNSSCGCLERVYKAIKESAREGKGFVCVRPKDFNWKPYEYNADPIRDEVIEKLKSDGFNISFEFPEITTDYEYYGIHISWE